MTSLLSLNSKLILGIAYGFFVALNVNYYSFDIDAIEATIDYFIYNDLSYAEVLAYNSFSTYLPVKVLEIQDSETFARVFYGICATFRFIVFSLIFPIQIFIPIFFSMTFILDFNTSRYSLAISLFLLIIFVLQKNRKKYGQQRLVFYLLYIPFFFHLHHFSIVFAAFFARVPMLIRILAIFLLPIIVLSLPDVFSRFLADRGEPFPRIALLYLFFTIVLLAISPQIVVILNVFTILLMVLVLFFSGGFSPQYFTRFSFLLFEYSVIVLGLDLKHQNILMPFLRFNLKYFVLVIVCLLSFLYQLTIVGGNIWRFF